MRERATRGGSGDRMMPRIVTRDPAGDRATDATLCGNWGIECDRAAGEGEDGECGG